VAGALALGACATQPTGPSIMAMPGSGKTFDQFRADDYDCRGYAQGQSGSAAEVGNDTAVRNAAIGTAIGGRGGAGVGAAGGLVVGSAAGAGAGESSARGVQRRYDNAYIQC